MIAYLPSLLIFAYGLVMLLRSVTRIAHHVRARRGLALATGVVVALEPVEQWIPNVEQPPSWSLLWRYRALVEFTTATGMVRQCTRTVSLPEDAVRIGERLPVRYDAGEPDHAFLDSYAESHGTLVVPTLICCGCLYVGWAAWPR